MTNQQSERKDNILAFLVEAANNNDLSISITLNVNGALVTGTIVSAKEYFTRLGEAFQDGNEVAQQLSDNFAQASEAIGSGENGSASFIHLSDAKVFCGSSKPTPSKGEVLWRGALSDINGFFLEDIPENGDEDDDSDSQSLKEENSKLTDRIGKLEEMIGKLRPDDSDDQSEEQEEESKSEEKEDSDEETSKDDEDKEKSQKKRSGTKSSSAKTKKKASAEKTSSE